MPARGDGALGGVRVLDLTSGMAGAIAGMLLADLGADVVKIDTLPPTPATLVNPMWDRSKRRLPVVREDSRLLDLVADLVGRADVVLVGTARETLGLDQLLARGLRPGEPARWVTLPPYLLGSTPWAGGGESPGLLFASLGHAWSQSSYADVPVDCLFPLAVQMQGIWAATLAVALLVGARSGRRVPGMAVAGGAHGAVIVSPSGFAVQRDNPHVHRLGGPGGSSPNYRCYRCADGEWLFFGAFTTGFIARGFAALGLSHLFDDPRLGGDPAAVRLPDNALWLRETLDELFAQRPRAEWLAVLESADVPCAPVLETRDWLDHGQIEALGLRVEVPDEAGRNVVMPGPLIGMSDTPAVVAPDALERRTSFERLLEEWDERRGHRAEEAEDPDGDGSFEPPLRSVRVLDLGTIIAGPYVGTLLGELGADVVKVERPPHGDEFRLSAGGRVGIGFAVYNRDQRSILVDLGHAPGTAAFKRLVGSADVVVENYRPGVVERLGIDHASLAQVNPRVTTVSVNAFGGVGPLGQRPGFDPVVQAMSGIMRSQGGRNPDDSPVFLTVPINDVVAAGLAALGACASLHARHRLGHGQHVGVTLCAASCLVQGDLLVRWEGRPEPPVGGRDFRGPNPLDRLYRAADGWLRLGGRWPEDLGTLATAGLLEEPDLRASPEVLADDLEQVLGGLALADVLRRCEEVGLAAVKVRQPCELLDDTELTDHGLLAVLERDERGPLRAAAGRWLDMPGLVVPPPVDGPTAGSSTIAVLHEAGVADDQIDEMLANGAVVSAVERTSALGTEASFAERGEGR